jgi:RNA recognition motif-containing protein
VGRKLYVGNLPYSVTEAALKEKFGPFGQVESVNLIVDRDTGRSKGFGFVEMSSEAEAQAVIKGLDGTDYEGRPLRINEAKPQQKRSGGGGGYGGGGGGGGYGGGGRGDRGDRGGRW